MSLLLAGLTAGIFLASQLGQVRVQNRMNVRDLVLVNRSFEEAVGRVMPTLTIAAGVSMLVVPESPPDGSEALRARWRCRLTEMDDAMLLQPVHDSHDLDRRCAWICHFSISHERSPFNRRRSFSTVWENVQSNARSR